MKQQLNWNVNGPPHTRSAKDEIIRLFVIIVFGCPLAYMSIKYLL